MRHRVLFSSPGVRERHFLGRRDAGVRILVTNDDGIYSPGISALAAELRHIGDVDVVAPLTEQSGVSHSITYMTPLIVREVYHGEQLFGRAVAGSPADCVKLAMLELCNTRPNLVVSGINAGANVGINVLYSGTVAAAIEGAFFGVTSIAVSLAQNHQPDYSRAARIAVGLIRQLLVSGIRPGSLWNLNLPESRPEWPLGVKVLPMGLERYRERMERRLDPRGREYYWGAIDVVEPLLPLPDTDVSELNQGYATWTPLHFDLTDREQQTLLSRHEWHLSE